MRGLILTEGGQGIGFGHISRCMALKQCFNVNGIEVDFVVQGDESVRTLDESDMVVSTWRSKSDVDQWLSHINFVIIDSYLGSAELYQYIQGQVDCAVYLDDYQRIRYPAGILINGSFQGGQIRYENTEGAQYLCGAQYAILRQDFWEVSKRICRNELKHVLLSFGGVDSKQVTQRVLHFLNQQYPDLQKHVVLGNGFTQLDQIKSLQTENVSIYQNLSAQSMKDLMQNCDIAVSSGGQIIYELARTGTPTIGICVAENQLPLFNYAGELSFLRASGSEHASDLFVNIEHAMDTFKASRTRQLAAEDGQSRIDGQGVQRVVQEIIKYAEIGMVNHAN